MHQSYLSFSIRVWFCSAATARDNDKRVKIVAQTRLLVCWCAKLSGMVKSEEKKATQSNLNITKFKENEEKVKWLKAMKHKLQKVIDKVINESN